MSLLRSLTRAGLGASFLTLGWDAFLVPGGRTAKAADLGVPQPEVAVMLNGGAMVVAGAALASGLAPRLSAAVLAGLLVPTTLAGHAYWQQSESQARAQQRIQFLKNVCMFGGLVEVVLSGPRHRKEDA